MIKQIVLLLLFCQVTTCSSCLDGYETPDNCYTDTSQMMKDLGTIGASLTDLMGDAGDEKVNVESIPEPERPIPLRVLENVVKEHPDVANTPIGYLTRYGYVKGVMAARCGSNDNVQALNMADALSTFKVVAGLSPEYLIAAMQFKRCSVPDITFDESGFLNDESLELISKAIGADNVREHRRRKRYTIAKFGRGDIGKTKTEYTYRLETDTIPDKTTLIPKLAQRDVASAFQLWQDAMEGAVKFRPAGEGETPDFDLKFLPDKHGDGMDFTTDKEYAHAPYPGFPYHGEVHYRAAEKWASSTTVARYMDSVNFEWVTAHELGHALGLQHSEGVKDSIMRSFYNKTMHNLQPVELAQDDINGIQYLYGSVAVACRDGWKGFKDTCYKLEHRDVKVSWASALAICRSYGATLVTIPDEARNSFVLMEVAAGYTPYWIGKRSDSENWENGTPFGAYIPQYSKLKVSGKKAKCLRATVIAGSQIWDYQPCTEKAFIENFVCEMASSSTVDPTPEATEEPDETTVREDIPCQTYLQGAVRWGKDDTVYIFGNAYYFKYRFNGRSSPELLEWPRLITDDFKGIPEYFDAVFRDPYNPKVAYFMADDTVFEWRVQDSGDELEEGRLKSNKKTRRKFRTRNYMRGATQFDDDSVFFFAKNGEVGKWSHKKKYEVIKKWDFFDTRRIDGVMPGGSKLEDYLIFFQENEYFYLRKSDGLMPKKFRRLIEMDFGQLRVCSIVAPLIELVDFPDISPDEAIGLENNAI